MYPSTAELVEASSVVELTELDAPVQGGLRDEAIRAVERYCRQSFTVDGAGSGSGSGDDDATTRVLDGSGSRTLYLPRRLARLDALVASGASLGAADVLLREERNRLDITDETAASTWATRAMADITGRRHAVFPAGPATVTITGVWGWLPEEVPPEVATALRLDMEDRALANQNALSESVRSARALGVTGIDQGGLSVQLGDREPHVSVRVARQLSDLRWRSASGALA